MYDVRFSMYDLDYSAPEARMRCPQGENRRLPMYDVGCTTRTTAVSAYGQREGAAPQGRVGNGMPTSQRTIEEFARVAREIGQAVDAALH